MNGSINTKCTVAFRKNDGGLQLSNVSVWTDPVHVPECLCTVTARLSVMSDLTGIADDYANRHVLSEDVDFAEHKTAFSKESEEQASDEQEHEMDDLFGHDHGKFTRLYRLHCTKVSTILSFNSEFSAIRASPPTSGAESERLPSPDRVRRHALEYEEDDLPPEIAVEVKEAQVNFPNLPVPKSSDGNVSLHFLGGHASPLTH